MLHIARKCATQISGLRRLSTALLQDKALIDGKWVSAASGKTFEVYNPATGSIIAHVPDMDSTDAQKSIEAAKKAFYSEEWSGLTAKERSGLLKKWFRLLEQNRPEIAAIMTAESGKPINEAIGEAVYGDSFVEWFAEEARRIYGEVIPGPVPNRELFIMRQPIGVAGLITPWNFPHAMITRKAGAALAAGCTVVIKPAEDTPLTALALGKLAQEAGIPNGVINIVTSGREHAPAIGELFCKSPDVAGISFTGSTQVGKILYRNCADGIKRLGLELGGNAPFIVFNSANIDKAVDGAMVSKFRNCGQTCVSANRFLIQENVFDEFASKLKERVEGLRIGDGANSEVKVGPLINKMQIDKVAHFVEDAVSKGATVITGGGRLKELGELFYKPAIITNIKPNMVLYTEEVFGPVISLMKFKTEDEAVKIANDTQRGLAGYFFSEDVQQIFRVARKMEVGMVGINEGLISTAEAAFGGIKESGLGREGSRHGIDDYVYLKYMCVGNLKF
ncbi:unnamed protein product [Hermetia illucens]|uniref:Succinate-semialdehyde dehydrogenase n=1 Tax=Hermetia illucens TaxID=343691 RepID=A0A7R8V2F4_HERIL|nr:succinate-semialdehyde dehydrogenase, mitochondrial [Hermetia illucens]CAD7090415.1 unnamed protein product [Hermetia illucens]